LEGRLSVWMNDSDVRVGMDRGPILLGLMLTFARL
jgi:hypothetical protein